MRKLFYGLMLAGMLIMVIASPVLAAVYYASVQVQESDGSSYTRLPIMVSLDNEYLADNNYILATGLDTRVITGSSVELPHLVVDDRLLFVSNINANNTYNFKYTTGNTPLTDMPIIVGYDGFITIPSEISDDMQLGDDFEIEFDGYVDTSSGSDKNLIYKEDALRVFVSDDGEIMAIMMGGGTPTNENLLPDGEGYYTDQAVYGETNHWEAVDDPVGTPDDDSTYIFENGSEKDSFTIESSSIPEYAIINSVSVVLRSKKASGYSTTGTSGLRLDGADSTAEGNTLTSSYVNYTDVVTRPGGGDWVVSDLENLEVMCYFQSSSTTGRGTQLYVVANYTPSIVATVSGVSSGEHIIKVYADGTNLGIIVDEGEAGEVSDTTLLSGASVPDNANDIIINQNNVMPYFDYLKWTVSDTLIAWYQPVTMIIGTALPDREGADENGVITWGANPSGVDVDIGSLTAYSQPAPSGTITEPGQDIVDETGQPGWVEPTGTLTTNPFYPLVKMASDQTGFDVTQIWLMIATFFVIGGMLAVFGFVPHQLITVCVGGGITGFFISMHIYPFWTIFIFLVMGIAVVLWERAPAV